MTYPPTYNLSDLGSQAQMMSKNCNNERLAIVLQSITVGSMIIMVGVAATHLLREVFGSPGSGHSHGRSR